MRLCCASAILAFVVGYCVGAVTEPPRPREGVVARAVDFFHWLKPRRDNPVMKAHPGPAASNSEGPAVDHYGSL